MNKPSSLQCTARCRWSVRSLLPPCSSGESQNEGSLFALLATDWQFCQPLMSFVSKHLNYKLPPFWRCIRIHSFRRTTTTTTPPTVNCQIGRSWTSCIHLEAFHRRLPVCCFMKEWIGISPFTANLVDGGLVLCVGRTLYDEIRHLRCLGVRISITSNALIWIVRLSCTNQPLAVATAMYCEMWKNHRLWL